jgi:hypothetical protein
MAKHDSSSTDPSANYKHYEQKFPLFAQDMAAFLISMTLGKQ